MFWQMLLDLIPRPAQKGTLADIFTRPRGQDYVRGSIPYYMSNGFSVRQSEILADFYEKDSRCAIGVATAQPDREPNQQESPGEKC